MIVQYFIAATFWLSYLAITFASVITITDFVQRVQRSRARKLAKPLSQVENEPVKLHIREGLLEVNRLPEDEQEEP